MFEIITIDELMKRLDNYNHKELHVHHTWKPVKSQYNGSNGIALQTGMRNYHVNTHHWSDIGQHVTLLPDGLFVTGRDFGRTPCSIAGYNTRSFACEMLGNFDIEGTGQANDKGYDKLEGVQKESIIKLAQYFDRKGRYVRFHRENAPKTCPGTGIDKNQFMTEVRSQIKEEVKGMSITVLRRGDKGEEVKRMQVDLNKLGYTLAVDSSFGPATEAAVKAFQSKNGLEVDGVAGPITQGKIADLLAPKPDPETDWKSMYNQKVLELNLAKSEIQELKNKINQAKTILTV